MSSIYNNPTGDIVHLNVGGTRFSTSIQTLMWVPDSFFTALLSGRISSLKDETGAIFIDRDPKVFAIILNYLRTRDIDLKSTDLRTLRHEAEYYGIAPLVKRLVLCEDLNQSSCGDVLFYGYLPPPCIPAQDNIASTKQDDPPPTNAPRAAPGSIVRVPDIAATHPNPPPNSPSAPPSSPALPHTHLPHQRCHSRNSSLDLRVSSSSRNSADYRNGRNGLNGAAQGHSRTASLDLRHKRNSSADLNKLIKNDVSLVFGCNQVSNWADPLRVQIIKAHHHWIAVAYAHFLVCYRLKDSSGWQQVFTSPHIENYIERVAINAKMSQSSGGGGSETAASKMVAISYGSQVRLWGISEHGIRTNIGTFNLNVRVEYLFFIGSQLVALSPTGKIGVWHAMTHHWQIQDVVPIASFDTAGSFLLLGCNNGSIYYIDMQKFPLRMKDNDLLVTELYKDPSNDPITAISVYLTPKTTYVKKRFVIGFFVQAMDQFSILAFLFFFMSFHLSTTVCYLRSGYNDTKLAKDFDSPFLTRLFRIKRNQMQDGNRMFINEKARKYNHIDDEVLNWKIDESDSDEWNENEMVLRSRYKRSTSRKISKPAEIHSIDSLDEVLKEQIASVGNIGGMEDSWKFISNSEIPRFKSSDNLWQNFEHVENIDMTQEHEHEHSSIQHIRVPRDISQQNLAALINDNEAEGNKIKSNNGSYQPKLVAIQLIPIAIDANTANPSNEPISQNSSNVIKEDPSVNIAEQMDKDDLITKLRNRKNTVEANKLAYTLLDDLIKNTTTPSPDDSNENSAIENLLHLSIYNISEYFSNSNSKVALLTVDNATETVGNATEKTIMEFIFGNWIDGHVDSKINDSIQNQTERHNLTTSTTTETPKPKDKKTMLDFILGNWVYDHVDSKINDSLQAESHNATTPVRLEIVNYSHTKDINNTNGNQQEQDLQVNKSTDGVWRKKVKLAMDGFFIEMVDMVKYYTLKSIYSTTKILKKAAHMTAQFLNGVEEQVRNNTLVNKTAENIKAIQNTDMEFVKNTTGKIVQNNFDLMKNATGKILDNNLSLYGDVTKKVINQSDTNLPISSAVGKLTNFYLDNLG
ncbi:hypothetical protein M8J77_012308 [Diaphorina citri]|nr:hypothetical protein M8J77_012308 [Diaphorina citri]